MFTIAPASDDDPNLIRLADGAIRGWSELISISIIHVVKIDAWFGDRWYGFAGKALGALGIHNWSDLKVPPFHPHRVVESSYGSRRRGMVQRDQDSGIHQHQASESNLRNRITRFGDSIVFAWYSGDSRTSGRGSIMAYASTEHGTLGWYAGFVREKDDWPIVKLVGADQRQWAAMLAKGAMHDIHFPSNVSS